jgi:hypothetical protein
MQTHGTGTLRWMIALSAGLLLAAASSAPAADAPLRWKFKSGDKLNYVMERTAEGKLNLSGADIEFKATMIFDTTWNVKSVADDGTANIEQTVDRVQINMSSPLGGSLEYDSANPTAPDSPIWAQMEPMFGGMMGDTFKWKVSSQGKVADVELTKKLNELFATQKQGGNRQQGFGIGNNMFSDKGIKEFIEKSVLPLPAEAPGQNVSWKQHFDNPIRGIGTQMQDTTYSFTGSETLDGKSVLKIASSTELTFEPADNAQADLEITSQESKATFYFDPAAGHMIKSTSMQSSGLELSGARDLTQEIKETTVMKLGKSPAAKPAEAKAK